MNTSTDRIERQVLINASRARVWRALSDAGEFGDWFGVNFKGKTFVAGKHIQGKITYPGYEHLTMDVLIERIVRSNRYPGAGTRRPSIQRSTIRTNPRRWSSSSLKKWRAAPFSRWSNRVWTRYRWRGAPTYSA
jgi:hypothetical protein